MAQMAAGGGSAKKKQNSADLLEVLQAAAQKAAQKAKQQAAVQAAGAGLQAGKSAGVAALGREPIVLPKWTELSGGYYLPTAKGKKLAPDLTGRYNGVAGKQLAGPALTELRQDNFLQAHEAQRQKDPFAALHLEKELRSQKKNLRESQELKIKSLQETQQETEERAAKLGKQLQQADRRANALEVLTPGQAVLEKQNRDSLKAELQAAQQQRDSLAAQIREKKLSLLSLQEDWGAHSQYRPTANGKKAAYSLLNGVPQETGFDDILYDYINGNPEAVKLVDAGDTITGAYSLGFDRNHLKQMTGEEVKNYNYLYATGGKEQAEDYIKDIMAGLTRKQRAQETAQWAQRAGGEPVKASLFSVLEAPAKGLSYLGQLIDFAGDGQLDQNAGYNRYSYRNNAIREQVSGIVKEKWGEPGSILYQIGMGMGDFLVNTAITGGNQALSLAIVGTGAAADTAIAAKDRGLEDWQAFTLGTIAGAVEIVTKKVSLGTLLDKTSLGKNAVGDFLKNVLAEGSEEVESDLINLTADLLISKDKSEWNTAVRQYEAGGLSKQEAFGRALADQAAQMGEDFLGGALSGGVMSGAAVLGNRISGAVQNRNAGKRAQVSMDSAYKTLLEKGLFTDEAGQALLRANANVRNALGQNRLTDVRGADATGK